MPQDVSQLHKRETSLLVYADVPSSLESLKAINRLLFQYIKERGKLCNGHGVVALIWIHFVFNTMYMYYP